MTAYEKHKHLLCNEKELHGFYQDTTKDTELLVTQSVLMGIHMVWTSRRQLLESP